MSLKLPRVCAVLCCAARMTLQRYEGGGGVDRHTLSVYISMLDIPVSLSRFGLAVRR